MFYFVDFFNAALMSLNRRTGVLRPTQGPHNIASSSQRPRSKSSYYCPIRGEKNEK